MWRERKDRVLDTQTVIFLSMNRDAKFFIFILIKKPGIIQDASSMLRHRTVVANFSKINYFSFQGSTYALNLHFLRAIMLQNITSSPDRQVLDFI